MRKVYIILLLVTGLNQLYCYGQASGSAAVHKFFAFVNNYQVDSLQSLLTDDFQLRRTYTSYGHDKRSFLENYIPQSKNFNGKFSIVSVIPKQQVASVLVEDQSDYLNYLRIDFPKWEFQLSMNERGQIVKATIDTTTGYELYLKQVVEKSQRFEEWLKQTYPGESNTSPQDSGLLLRRLKEYADGL